jgi:hypothetical protein
MYQIKGRHFMKDRNLNIYRNEKHKSYPYFYCFKCVVKA